MEAGLLRDQCHALIHELRYSVFLVQSNLRLLTN